MTDLISLPPPQVPVSQDGVIEPSRHNYDKALDVTVRKLAQVEVLEADLTIYVRADGNDSNDGKSNNATGAFLTHAAAMEAASRINKNGYDLTVQSELTSSTVTVTLPKCLGNGTSIFRGDPTTPSNRLISVTGGHAISASGDGVEWVVTGFKVSTTTSGTGVQARDGASLGISNMDFGACANDQIYAIYAVIFINNPITISGGALRHKQADMQAYVNGPFGGTTTITGTPAFSEEFAKAFGDGIVEEQGVTYSGGATGKRFKTEWGGNLLTYSASLTYFPGNAAGVISGGLYDNASNLLVPIDYDGITWNAGFTSTQAASLVHGNGDGFYFTDAKPGNQGCVIYLQHATTSQANNDKVCSVIALGNDSANVSEMYGEIDCTVTTVSTAPTAHWQFQADAAGTLTPSFAAGGSGLHVTSGSPTFPGAGGINLDGFLITKSTTVTISSGVITVTGSYVRVETEGGTTLDDLDTINGTTIDGTHLYIRATDLAHTVVLKDNTDNIRGPGDVTLDHSSDIAHLIYDKTLAVWLVVSVGDNAA